MNNHTEINHCSNVIVNYYNDKPQNKVSEASNDENIGYYLIGLIQVLIMTLTSILKLLPILIHVLTELLKLIPELIEVLKERNVKEVEQIQPVEIPKIEPCKIITLNVTKKDESSIRSNQLRA